MRDGAAEVFGDGLSHVGESLPGAEGDAAAAAGRVGDDGDVFAGVVGGGIEVAWVAAVVGSDEEKIAGAEGVEEGAEEGVEFFERAGETFDVFAMAVEHVEVNEVGEDEAGGAFAESGVEFVHAVGVVFRGDVVRDTAAVVDVVDFADAKDGGAAVGENVEKHGARRLDDVVVAALGAAEITGRAKKRSRDDAANAMRAVEQFAGDFAYTVQLGDGDDLFVSGDLEDAVAGGVDDGAAGANVFIAKLLDDFRARGGPVAERLAADGFFEGGDEVGGETVGINRESLVEPDASHFPMAGGGVLPRRASGAFAETAVGVRGRSEVVERGDVGEAKTNEIGQPERAGFGDVAESAAAGVAVVGGVRKRTDADGVEDDPDDAGEGGHVYLRQQQFTKRSGEWLVGVGASS